MTRDPCGIWRVGANGTLEVGIGRFSRQNDSIMVYLCGTEHASVIYLSVPLTSVYIVLILAMSLSLLFFVSSVQFVSNELLNEHCSCS